MDPCSYELFLLRITHTIISQSSADSSWITLYTYFQQMDFTVNTEENFHTSSFVHSINTRNKHHLHRPYANSSRIHKSTFCAGIRIFNSLPCRLTSVEGWKGTFQVALRRYLDTPFFYSRWIFRYIHKIEKATVSFSMSARNSWAPTG